MAKIKNTNDSYCWKRCIQGKHSSIIGGHTICKITLKINMVASQKQQQNMGISLSQDSDILLLGIYPKDV